MDSPAPLLWIQDGKIEPNNAVVKELESRNKPAVVISIIGKLRSGKSFLMNKIAGKENGFTVDNKNEAQTKGVWIWILPHPKYREHDLILLDTEGFGDTKQANDNLPGILFTFTYLLSSALVYNVSEQVDSDTLDFISSFRYLNEDIALEKRPLLLLAVRNFCLELKDDEDDKYLETILTSDGNEQLHLMKENVIKIFPDRKCFRFRPYSSWGGETTNKHFYEKMSKFVQYVRREVKVKMFDDSIEVCGRDLAVWVAKYIGDAKEERPMSIKSATEIMRDGMVIDLEAKCFKQFAQDLAADLDLKKKVTVLVEIEKAGERALERFDNKAVDAPNTDAVRKELKSKIKEERDNVIQSLTFIQSIVAHLEEKRDSFMQQDFTFYKEMSEKLKIPVTAISAIAAVYFAFPLVSLYLPEALVVAIGALIARIPYM